MSDSRSQSQAGQSNSGPLYACDQCGAPTIFEGLCGFCQPRPREGTTKEHRDRHMWRSRFLDTGRERTMG